MSDKYLVPINAGQVTLTDQGGVFGPYTASFNPDTGAFTKDVKVMPGGSNYQFDAAHGLHLGNRTTHMLNPLDSYTASATRLLGGDANNDGSIDISDLTCIGVPFGERHLTLLNPWILREPFFSISASWINLLVSIGYWSLVNAGFDEKGDSIMDIPPPIRRHGKLVDREREARSCYNIYVVVDTTLLQKPIHFSLFWRSYCSIITIISTCYLAVTNIPKIIVRQAKANYRIHSGRV